MPAASTFRVLIPSDFRRKPIGSHEQGEKCEAIAHLDSPLEQGDLYDLILMKPILPKDERERELELEGEKKERRRKAWIHPCDLDLIFQDDDDEESGDDAESDRDLYPAIFINEDVKDQNPIALPEMVPYYDSDYDCYGHSDSDDSGGSDEEKEVQGDDEEQVQAEIPIVIVISDYDCEDEEDRHSLLDLDGLSLVESWPPQSLIKLEPTAASISNAIPPCHRGCLHVPRRSGSGVLDRNSFHCFTCRKPTYKQAKCFPPGFGRSSSAPSRATATPSSPSSFTYPPRPQRPQGGRIINGVRLALSAHA